MATRTNKTASVSINEDIAAPINEENRYLEFNDKRYDMMEYTEKGEPKGVKDWTYLLNKEAGSNHHVHIFLMKNRLGEEAFEELAKDPARFAMAYLAMHRWMQESAPNKDRDGYRPTTVASVVKRSETLLMRQQGKDGEDVIGRTVGHLADEAPKPKAAPKSRARKTPTKAVAEVAPATETEEASAS